MTNFVLWEELNINVLMTEHGYTDYSLTTVQELKEDDIEEVAY